MLLMMKFLMKGFVTRAFFTRVLIVEIKFVIAGIAEDDTAGEDVVEAILEADVNATWP